ncbi:MAG: nuclease-related domain-containing protein [Steroidobacteraceae bacterium]
MEQTLPLPTFTHTQLVFAAGAAAGALVVALALAAWRWFARRHARQKLIASITDCGFENLREVLLPDGQGGWLHFDFLLLTARGVVVVDLRDVAGNIFGGDQMTEWTVMHRARRYTFQNPQSGLYDRLAAVRAIASDLPVEGLVLFTNRGRFPKGLPRYTRMLESLASEYPVLDRGAVASTLERWKPSWRKLVELSKPSKLADPKPAV